MELYETRSLLAGKVRLILLTVNKVHRSTYQTYKSDAIFVAVRYCCHVLNPYCLHSRRMEHGQTSGRVSRRGGGQYEVIDWIDYQQGCATRSKTRPFVAHVLSTSLPELVKAFSTRSSLSRSPGFLRAFACIAAPPNRMEVHVHKQASRRRWTVRFYYRPIRHRLPLYWTAFLLWSVKQLQVDGFLYCDFLQKPGQKRHWICRTISIRQMQNEQKICGWLRSLPISLGSDKYWVGCVVNPASPG